MSCQQPQKSVAVSSQRVIEATRDQKYDFPVLPADPSLQGQVLFVCVYNNLSQGLDSSARTRLPRLRF